MRTELTDADRAALDGFRRAHPRSSATNLQQAIGVKHSTAYRLLSGKQRKADVATIARMREALAAHYPEAETLDDRRRRLVRMLEVNDPDVQAALAMPSDTLVKLLSGLDSLTRTEAVHAALAALRRAGRPVQMAKDAERGQSALPGQSHPLRLGG